MQAGRWWWWSWVVVGNWGWMVGGSRWFVVDSVWVISFIEVLIRRAQKSLEIRAKYVARKIARFDAGAVVVANALSGRCWCCFHWWLWGCGGVCANPSTMTLLVYHTIVTMLFWRHRLYSFITTGASQVQRLTSSASVAILVKSLCRQVPQSASNSWCT